MRKIFRYFSNNVRLENITQNKCTSIELKNKINYLCKMKLSWIFQLANKYCYSAITSFDLYVNGKSKLFAQFLFQFSG